MRKMYAFDGTFMKSLRYEQHKYSKHSEILYQILYEMPQSTDKEST